MKKFTIQRAGLDVSRLAYGCMNIGGARNQAAPSLSDRKAARQAMMTAFEAGITLYDHADIYTRGNSEAVFGDVLKDSPGLRDKMVIQSKCGIRFQGQPQQDDPQRYDFSYEHIINAVQGSLRRLQTDHLDILLLHRPDPLVEPAEVARAFDQLQKDGKVLHFGVSNHTTAQMELLRKNVRQPLVINQVELSLLHAGLIYEGIVANRADATTSLSSGILDYCRANDILVQAWAPLAGGKLFRKDMQDVLLRRASECVCGLAGEKKVSPEAIMLAWLLRHPAGIQPVIGTTQPERIKACCQADQTTLSREEWYTLFLAAWGKPLP
ncbi:MAG: aldo/keto reductase [Lentisphaerota bacterium]